MAKAAILMAAGYEEGETLTIVDILRRAGIECDTLHFGENPVPGMHGMQIFADKAFSDDVDSYDALILPGGRPGGANLLANDDVIAAVRSFDAAGKIVAAMCSGTLVPVKAGIVEGRHVTGYYNYGEKMPGAIFEEKPAVRDGNLITSRGPATPYPFAYMIAEAFGADTAVLRERMLYNFAGGKQA